MKTDSNRPEKPTTLDFVSTHLGNFTFGILVLQIGLLAGDIYFFWGEKSFFRYPWEIGLPYVLIPLWGLLRKKLPESLPRDLEMFGGFTLAMVGLLIPALAGFQVLSWYFDGPLNGGVFYFPSLILSALWGFRKKRSD